MSKPKIFDYIDIIYEEGFCLCSCGTETPEGIYFAPGHHTRVRAYQQGGTSWNKDLTKENNTTMKEHAERMTGSGNPQYGRDLGEEWNKQNAKKIKDGMSKVDMKKIVKERRRSYKGDQHPRYTGCYVESIEAFKPEYSEWRSKVYNIDNYTCYMCGEGGDLNCHHILKQSKFPKLRYEIWNGITLCKPCHKSIFFKEPQYALNFLHYTFNRNQGFVRASSKG